VLSKQPSMRRLIVAATIGNIFEWFDFVVHGFFAVTIAEVFFPAGNPTVSLLITFGAFGLAYFVRPLGAIVVGGYTDRAGRKAGLLLSMALMMIGTTLMAVTPDFATIGLAAPIIITIARLLQGFSVTDRDRSPEACGIIDYHNVSQGGRNPNPRDCDQPPSSAD
jgi:MHS family proline/betaine transporter-like MFS transporter